MVMLALSISSKLWPDRMLPKRSGSGAVAGTLLLGGPMETGLATGW